jgi:hypothetical protein
MPSIAVAHLELQSVTDPQILKAHVSKIIRVEKQGRACVVGLDEAEASSADLGNCSRHVSESFAP